MAQLLFGGNFLAVIATHHISKNVCFDVELLLHYSLGYRFNVKGNISVVCVKINFVFCKQSFLPPHLYTAANITATKKKIFLLILFWK